MTHRSLSIAALCGVALTAFSATAEVDNFALGDGHSGPFASTGANQVINAYAPVTLIAGATLTLGATTGTGTFGANDLVLIWQPGGFTTAMSGDGTAIDLTASTGAGHYEFARVQGVLLTVMTLTAPLVSSFDTNNTQVIRVPEYTTVSVTGTHSLTAPNWNGRTGGIVAFLATGAVTVDGAVKATGAGFRAGLAPTQDGTSNCLGDDGLPPQYGQKGEGIQGTAFGATHGGKGNVANGGGGGNCHNAAGGGGGHAAAGGQGGGRWSDNADFGGHGGVKLVTTVNQLSFGGGGGAGHVNQSTGGNGAGANGGGVIFVRARAVGGTGSWNADGNDAIDNPEPCDPGGGGGAGGLLHIRSASTISCGSASAKGGKGGSHGSCASTPFTTSAMGVGGGGAGGYGYLQGSTVTCTPVLTGGPQGTSSGNTSIFAQPGGTGTPGTVPPGGFAVAVVTAPANGSVTANQRPTLTATGTPGYTMFIYVDGTLTCSGVVGASGSYSCTPGSDLSYAAHAVTAQVSSTGNVMDATPMSPAVNFTVAPVPVVVLNAVTPINSGNATTYAVSGTCVNNAGPVTISVPPVTAGPLVCTANAFTATLNLSAVSDGPVTITASQTNAQGTATDTKNTFKDIVVLAPVISAPAAASTVAAATATISGTSEANAAIQVFNGMSPLCTATADAMGVWACPAGLPAGAYLVSAVQTDPADNVSPASANRMFTAVIAPLITITNPAAINASNVGAYSLSGTCSDTSSVSVSVGTIMATASCTAGSWSITVDAFGLADAASISLSASGTNVAGTGTATRTVAKDTVVAPPVIAAPTAGATVPLGHTISGTSEAGSTVTVSEGMTVVCTTTADGSGNWSCGSTLLAGSHTIDARQRDAVGNTSLASASVTFTVAALPTVTVSTPATINSANVAAYPVSGVCTTGAGSVNLSVGTITATVPCTAGAFSTTVNVTSLADAAVVAVTASQTNLAGTGTDTKNTRKDTAVAAPVISLPTAGSDVAPSPTLSGTAEAGAVVTVKEGTTTVCTATTTGMGNWSCSTSLAVGAHTITAAQVDTAGNSSVSSPARMFNVVGPPAVTLTAPGVISGNNVASYTVAGTCTTTAGTVSITVGSIVANTACTAGLFNTTVNVSALTDSSTVAVTVSQTTSGGVGSDTQNTRKDTVAAMPVIVAPANNNTTGLNPAISGTGESGATVTVKEGTATVCTAVVSSLGAWTCATTLGAGMHTVTASQTDTATNVSPSTAGTTFTVVTTPAVILDAPAVINATNAAAYTVSGVCISAAGTVTVSVGTVMGTTSCTSGAFTTTLDVTALVDGANIAVTAAQSNAGGTGNDSKSTRKDTTVVAPVIVVPAAAATVATNPMISGTAEANASVTVREGTTVICTAQASSSGAWDCATTLAAGSHTITATQTDSAGNVSVPSAGRTFTVGATPTVTLDMPAVIASGNAAAYRVAGQCQDTAGDVTISVGTVTGTATCLSGHFSVMLNVTALADSSAVVITASQTNSAGTGTDTRSAIKDTAALAPVVSTPAAASMVGLNPTVTGTAEPGATVSVSEGTTVLCTATADSQGAWMCATTLGNGAHSITAQQTDTAGNVSPSSTATSFTVTGAPVVTVMATAINSMNLAAYPVRGSCTTSAGTVTIIVGTVMTTGPCTNGMYVVMLDVSAVPEGPAVTVKASQTNGSGTTEVTTVVSKDTGVPGAPSVSVPAANAMVSSVSTISGHAEPNSQVTVTVDGVVIGSAMTDSTGNWSLGVQTSILPGVHTVSATSTDAAGNISPASAAQSFTVTNPSVNITSPTAGTTVNAGEPTTVAGTGPAGGTVTIFIDGVAVGTTVVGTDGKWSFQVDGSKLPAGDHTLTAKSPGGALSPEIRITAAVKANNNHYAGAGLGGCSTSPESAGLGFAVGALLVLLRRRRH